MERNSQDEEGGEYRGRNYQSAQVDHMDAIGFTACTAKRRQEWSEAVSRAGEEVRDVETEGHARPGQSVEAGSGGNGGRRDSQTRERESQKETRQGWQVRFDC